MPNQTRMSQGVRPFPITADSDDIQFCGNCSFAPWCLENGYDVSDLAELHVLVEHVGPIAEGEYIFREGETFDAIAGIRQGTVKTYVIDLNGKEQVQGFYLPGEVIGLSAISQGRYPCNAVALEPVQLCRFTFSRLATLSAKLPALQDRLFRLLSEDIGKAALLAGDFSAAERMAAFVVELSRRYRARGLPPGQFRLPMARVDIANYLGLAPETISRIIRRFQQDGLLHVQGRHVEISDLPRLSAMASNVLRT